MKKQQQLGMNPSTAANRLVKDVLYSLVVKTGQNNCYHCGFPMSRETFSIEHKEAWLDSEDPLKLFFDLDNISFSHHSCNIKAGRKPAEAVCGTAARYNKYGCRCEPCKEARSVDRAKTYTKERRQATYQRTGK